MHSVFGKYDGKNAESSVVDYLQEHVRKHLNCPENYLEKNNWVLSKEFGLGRERKRVSVVASWNSALQWSLASDSPRHLRVLPTSQGWHFSGSWCEVHVNELSC